jgi:hypothetical protein
MTVLQNLSRVAIAAAVALFALVPTAPAEEFGSSSVVVPNSLTFAYNLAPGAVSAPVTLPANVPVQIMGTCLTVNFRGVGQVTALRIPNQFIEWVGLDSTAGAAITQGFSGAAGTKILFIDFSPQQTRRVGRGVSRRASGQQNHDDQPADHDDCEQQSNE